MAGMLWSKALPLVKDLFKRYWQTGTVLTRESDVKAANKLNPTFVYSSAGEIFNLHPGTFPQGFHLAPAMVSTFPEAKNAPRLGTEDAIINLMKQQSESWGKAFLASRAAGAITLRFFAGDALALCRALNTWRTTLNSTTGVFGSDWHAGQITFFDAVPLQYDVIETSSLTVNLDILNLLIATAPLLKDSPASQSVLYTEERLSVKESEEGMPTLNRLGTTPPTIAALLGLAPRVFISDFSTYSDIHETLAREHVKRFRERIAWVNPSSGDRLARQQKLVMSFDVDDLAQIIYRIYYDMFAKEIARVVVVHGRTMPYEPPFHYTRETVVMLLKYVRRRVHLKNGTWDDFGAKFLQLIENDWTKAAGRTYWLDICLQLHLAGIHSTDSLKLVIPNDPTPPVLCVVLTVPRRRLQVLFDHKETKCTPVLEVHLKIPSNRALAYSSVHAIWGKCRETSNKVLLEVDEKGFEGDSDLVVMFWANTRLFREGSTFALSLKSFPQTSVLFGPKLGDTHGDDLEIFSAAFDDTRYIRMLKYRPHLKDEHTLAPEDLSDVVEPEFKPESDSVFVSANVGTGSNSRVLVSLTARVEIDSPAERGVLLEGVEVKASQLSPCTMKLEIGDYEHTVAYPYPIRGEDYKLRVARKSHYVEVIVPFSKPLDNSGYHLDKAPVLQNSNHSPWNIPHVSSDRMPLLNIKNPKDLDWLKTLIGLQHSVRERHVLNKHDPEELAVTINNWVGIKNTIRQVTTEASVSNKTASRVYSLSESGTTYALLLVGGVRLDLASSTVFLDAAYIPPATDAGPPIGQFSQVTTSQVERLAWQKLLPAFVERCRTWSHKSYCKYTAQGKIPLSTELNRSPICSCGQGVGFKGPEWSVVPSWKAMLPYATRVAICGLFAVTCSDIKVSQQSAPGAGFIQPQKRTDKTCWTLAEDTTIHPAFSRLLAMKFIAIFTTIIVSVSAATIVPRGGTPMSQQEAQAKLEAPGVYASSSGNCTDWWSSRCTSYEGILTGTVNSIITLRKASGCTITITGGTEPGHPDGPYSHFEGYAVNMRRNQCLYDYVKKYFHRIDENSWKSKAGNRYDLGKNAWDVTYY
ncbi:hypothetical protein FRC09_002635 [Ceratobasidium sp. 395]|nr:hypothetical protein FRC09_002635 [Ceratobasidium sp. 395]